MSAADPVVTSATSAPSSHDLLFADLQLPDSLLRALHDVGYESPSPIQAAAIPLFLAGRDVLGQAQTGTGKTAAFALPILARINTKNSRAQALVLTPTRELAIQVAEAFQTYAAHIPNFHVLPIYGGQSYGPQLSALRRGVQVVVGTPGRVIDHLEKGSLDLSGLVTLVLDEADEMLRMGFIDDVETILQQTPQQRQTALFSATMPAVIKRIAKTYLRDPAEVTIAAKTGTADNIRQRYWLVSGMHKLDALTRILEAEPFDGMIIFSRTKQGSEELAGKLQARGFSAQAINGDIAQQQRERTIALLKEGKIDILVATDVAARGLDVERISHVVNYDVPYDPESYTHRIGRTGRAGRSGEAILFITPREKNLLKVIERATRQPVQPMTLPTVQAVNDVRIARFKEQIGNALAGGGLENYQALIAEYEEEHNVPLLEIAAALAKMARGDVPLLLEKNQREPRPDVQWQENDVRAKRERPRFSDKPPPVLRSDEAGMARYRIAVGHNHGVRPGNIVGAIANEADLDSKYIGRIEIYEDYSLLDMPEDLPADILQQLQTVRVAGQQLRISRADSEHGERQERPERAARQERSERIERPERSDRHERTERPERAERTERVERSERPERAERAPRVAPAEPERAVRNKGKRGDEHAFPMQTFRLEVGSAHGVKPGNIVGAIANEAGLESRFIGRLEIFDHHSTIDLPAGMPKELMEHLKKVWVAGQQLRISLLSDGGQAGPGTGGGRRKN